MNKTVTEVLKNFHDELCLQKADYLVICSTSKRRNIATNIQPEEVNAADKLKDFVARTVYRMSAEYNIEPDEFISEIKAAFNRGK